MTFQSGLCRETRLHKRYHESEQNQTTQKNTQLNSTQLTLTTKHNKHKLTLILSHSYYPRLGQEVVPFGNHAHMLTTFPDGTSDAFMTDRTSCGTLFRSR